MTVFQKKPDSGALERKLEVSMKTTTEYKPRVPYVSPSQLSVWHSNREEWWLKYGTEFRAPRIPQTQPMSVGSSFDAYTKSSLNHDLFGDACSQQFEFEAIFESQVEVQNRDWAREAGAYAFACYKHSGAYDDLRNVLLKCDKPPRFEFSIEGVVGEVPMLGKPDLFFVHPSGTHVILDWKVNGFCSKYPTSPAKFYKLIRDGWDTTQIKASRGSNSSHPNYEPLDFKGLEIHKGYFEEIDWDWATQLAIYSWLLGEKVGSENLVACIEQLVAKPYMERPLIRVANFRARISKGFQESLMSIMQDCWNAICTGYIFTDVPREQSDARCRTLDLQAITMYSESEAQILARDFADKRSLHWQ